jgi:hypothetical protein
LDKDNKPGRFSYTTAEGLEKLFKAPPPQAISSLMDFTATSPPEKKRQRKPDTIDSNKKAKEDERGQGARGRGKGKGRGGRGGRGAKGDQDGVGGRGKKKGSKGNKVVKKGGRGMNNDIDGASSDGDSVPLLSLAHDSDSGHSVE